VDGSEVGQTVVWSQNANRRPAITVESARSAHMSEEKGVVDLANRRRDVAELVRSRWGDLLTEVGNTVVERDHARVPPPADLLEAMGSTGLMALSLPEKLGGAGVDAVTWGMVLEQIGLLCADSGLPLIITHQIEVARVVGESGRTELIDRYAIPMTQSKCGAAFAYSENADAFSFRTVLHRKGDGYVLSGHKSYVTRGQISDVFLTYAADDAGDLRALLVERDDPGVTVTPAEPVGMRTAGAAAITFDDVFLPADRMLEASDGLSHAQRFLNKQRLWIPCAPVGRGQAVLADCVAHLKATQRFGGSIAELDNVKASLGRMYVAIESARAMVYQMLGHFAGGRAEALFDPVIAAAKCFVVGQVRLVLELAQNLLGGHGFYGTPHFGRYVRDYHGLSLAAGTQDVLEVNLGAGVVARAGPAAGGEVRGSAENGGAR
jgi:alkylation response protein AidB-like acyl-CoA dehydrogenase